MMKEVFVLVFLSTYIHVHPRLKKNFILRPSVLQRKTL